MFDVLAPGHDPRLVPLTERLGGVFGRGEDRVAGPCGSQPVQAVKVSGVVQDLELRAGFPDVVVLLGRTIDHAAVAAFGHLPFQDQFKVVELLEGDDIAPRLTLLRTRQQRAVLDLPTGWHCL